MAALLALASSLVWGSADFFGGMLTKRIPALIVVAVWLLGVGTLKDLALVQLVGIVVGTYSSIYIASALALDLKLAARDLLPVQREKDAVDEMP